MRRSLAVVVAAVPVIAVLVGVSGLAQAPKAGSKAAPEQQVAAAGVAVLGGRDHGQRHAGPERHGQRRTSLDGLPDEDGDGWAALRQPDDRAEAWQHAGSHGGARSLPHLPGRCAGQQADLPADPGTRPARRTHDGHVQDAQGPDHLLLGLRRKGRSGQPVILTFDKLMRGENDPELQTLQGAVGARSVRTPTPGNSKTYGDWPHEDRKKRNKDLEATFPIGSTLAGQHLIEGTYTPKIDFTLPEGQTFMEPVRYASTEVQASGAIALNWNAPARATGYSLGVMAPEKVDDETANIIMWSSAERPATFVMMEHLTPAEVKRLVALKAVLPPSTTNCTVPAEVIKATKNGSMLMFTAFGDEATFIEPARPADPKVTWDQEWFARVSFKAVRMDMISPEGVMDLGAMSGGTASGPRPTPSCRTRSTARSWPSSRPTSRRWPTPSRAADCSGASAARSRNPRPIRAARTSRRSSSGRGICADQRRPRHHRPRLAAHLAHDNRYSTPIPTAPTPSIPSTNKRPPRSSSSRARVTSWGRPGCSRTWMMSPTAYRSTRRCAAAWTSLARDFHPVTIRPSASRHRAR